MHFMRIYSSHNVLVRIFGQMYLFEPYLTTVYHDWEFPSTRSSRTGNSHYAWIRFMNGSWYTYSEFYFV